MIDMNQNSIIKGISGVAKRLEIGDIIENAQKLTIIIGSVNKSTARVVHIDSLIENFSGRNVKNLTKVSQKQTNQSNARNDK
jgi:uncharacterized protein YkvS